MCHGLHVDGIGVLGDSYSDEYCFYAPVRASAQNWVEQLADDTDASFGRFYKDDPPGPRNAGFAYNWATSGATSTQMLEDGMVAGVAAQAASGKVDLVTMFIGGDDFRAVFAQAVSDPVGAGASIPGVVQKLLTNIGTAAGTVLSPAVVAANPDVHLILTTIPKLSYLPEVRNVVVQIPQFQALVDAVDGAIGIVNQQLIAMADQNSRIAVNDYATWVDDAFAQPIFKVGNVVMDRTALSNPTNDPTCFVLADGLHSGTVAQGLLANLYVQTANDAFDAHLQSLSTKDILKNADLYQGPPKCKPASVFAFGKAIGHHCVDDVLN
jgi:phospholipase/lecithinase/hemolysin